MGPLFPFLSATPTHIDRTSTFTRILREKLDLETPIEDTVGYNDMCHGIAMFLITRLAGLSNAVLFLLNSLPHNAAF